MPHDPEEQEVERRPTRAEDALFEEPDPMTVAARANTPVLTRILTRERALMGEITLLDSAELIGGLQCIVYTSRHGMRWALYHHGVHVGGGVLNPHPGPGENIMGTEHDD